ncbi:MAG TPA: MoaD/ThiS family protein [Micromonosporaceae bacterium]
MLVVRYFAAARAAAGCAEEKVTADTLDDLVATLVATHDEPLARVLSVVSFLVDGVAWHDRGARLPDGATIDVLPPFAGG